jgi:succinyl-diaminopimelate desuccinylase
MDNPAPTVSFEAVDAKIELLYPQMARALLELMRFPSVSGAPLEGKPFGEPIAQSLDYCIELCRELGLVTENIDGYMAVADMIGKDATQVGVLGHIDVVQATKEDWIHAPYEPVIEDGKIYGRGAVDDKGPMLAALYGGIALRECGVELTKTVRFLFGANEESGFKCVEHYNKVRKPPACGFSPDGMFPLVIGEKGLCMYRLGKSWPEDSGAKLQLVRCQAGQMSNIVPDRAEAVFCLRGGCDLPQPAGENVAVTREGDTVTITATGLPAHASLPDTGKNALDEFLAYLLRIDFSPSGAKEFLSTLARLYKDSSFGKTLGIAGEDAYSKLTNVPAALSVTDGYGTLTCDMRFPVTHTGAQYKAALKRIAAENGLDLLEFEASEPLFKDENDPVAAGLLAAYRGFTGDMSTPCIMGGGTYAKHLPNFFAFGPAFEAGMGDPHKADEFIGVRELLSCAKIYARGIYELAK